MSEFILNPNSVIIGFYFLPDSKSYVRKL